MNRSTEFTDIRRLIAYAMMVRKPHGNIISRRRAKFKFLIKREMQRVAILSSMKWSSALLNSYSLFCVLSWHITHAGATRRAEGENKTKISPESLTAVLTNLVWKPALGTAQQPSVPNEPQF